MANETDFEKHEKWREESKAYLRNFSKHWAWWVSTLVGGGIVSLWMAGGGMIPQWVCWLVGLSGVFIASFLTWRDEKRRADRALFALAQIRANAAALESARMKQLQHSSRAKIAQFTNLVRTQNVHPIQALIDCGVADFERNDEVILFLQDGEKYGVSNPLKELDFMKENWLEFLLEIKLRGAHINQNRDVSNVLDEMISYRESKGEK